MRKIISLFARDWVGDGLVRDEIVPGAEWVVAGEGVATRKFDGTCCLVRGGLLYRRYDAKGGRKPPAGFEAAQEPDPVTGHQPGWIACDRANSSDKWHWQAWDNQPGLEDGTYELCGPKVQSNPERALLVGLHPSLHFLIRHGSVLLADCPRSFEGLRSWFMGRDLEGVVWHHADGRMVKIKQRDFGLRRRAWISDFWEGGIACGLTTSETRSIREAMKGQAMTVSETYPEQLSRVRNSVADYECPACHNSHPPVETTVLTADIRAVLVRLDELEAER